METNYQLTNSSDPIGHFPELVTNYQLTNGSDPIGHKNMCFSLEDRSLPSFICVMLCVCIVCVSHDILTGIAHRPITIRINRVWVLGPHQELPADWNGRSSCPWAAAMMT